MDFANRRFRSLKYNRLSSNYLRDVQNTYKTQVPTNTSNNDKRENKSTRQRKNNNK